MDEMLTVLENAPTGSAVLSDRIMYSEGFIRSVSTGEWVHEDGRVKSEYFDPTRQTCDIGELIKEAEGSWKHEYDAPSDKALATIEHHNLEVTAFHTSTALALCVAFRQVRLFG